MTPPVQPRPLSCEDHRRSEEKASRPVLTRVSLFTDQQSAGSGDQRSPTRTWMSHRGFAHVGAVEEAKGLGSLGCRWSWLWLHTNKMENRQTVFMSVNLISQTSASFQYLCFAGGTILVSQVLLQMHLHCHPLPTSTVKRATDLFQVWTLARQLDALCF